MKEIIDNLKIERKLLEEGYKYVAGIDEVGRGPLAGPVVVATCVMPLDDNNLIEGITDSKKLSEKKRQYFNNLIMEKSITYSIDEIDHKTIDSINILNATKEAMKKAVETMFIVPDIVLVDALHLDILPKQISVIKGDLYSYSIGCASIIAKVYRDALMTKYDDIYPGYGFASNKGYGTKEHIDAIKRIGPCPIHRMTFIKNFI